MLNECSGNELFLTIPFQNGLYCLCGNSYGRYENRSDTDDCLAEDCVDGKGVCGGSLKNAVYDLQAVPGWEPACLPGAYEYK